MLTIGILASIIVGLGEYLLHYVPGGPHGEIEMLEKVPLNRACIGHFLVVFGAPLYYVGYLGLYKIFKSTSPLISSLLLIFGILSFSIGGVWISSRYYAADVFQNSPIELHDYFVNSYNSHYQVLVWVLRILVTFVSISYFTLILKNKIGIPKYYVLFTPIILLATIISTLFWFKAFGEHIAPIAMNVTHFIFFGMILIHLLKKEKLKNPIQ